MIFIEENDDRFTIAESTLPNAGMGLFAKTFIPKNSTLEVIGVFVKAGGIADISTKYADRYKFGGKKGDANIIPLGFAGLVNHTDDTSIRNAELRYISGSKKSPHSSDLVYYFIKDVLPGQEILGNYGKNSGNEVSKISKNITAHDNNKEEWNRFLSFNLYKLKDLCLMLQ